MKQVTDTISITELKEMAGKMFGNLVKAVVDINKGLLVVDADQEKLLLESGSAQTDLWGINIYPENPKETRIEFDSMINLRPSFGNNSRGVDSEEIQTQILKLVNSKISE